MLIELESGRFPSVFALYRAGGSNFPLILAVIQQKQRGQIFVDNMEHPSSAVVITNFGFMSYLGAEQNEEFNTELAGLLATEGAIKPSYLLWYAPPANWQKKLDALGPNLARRRERIRFEFRKGRANYLRELMQCPVGFEFRNLDLDLIPKTEKFNLHIDSRFWSSASDFSKHGLGVCLMKDDEIVSLCYAACIADNLAEIDVVTEPEYRGQGLGVLVAQQIIRECAHLGITPAWDCFESNLASVKLAEKLGFIKAKSYPFYSFNIPFEFAQQSTA